MYPSLLLLTPKNIRSLRDFVGAFTMSALFRMYQRSIFDVIFSNYKKIFRKKGRFLVRVNSFVVCTRCTLHLAQYMTEKHKRLGYTTRGYIYANTSLKIVTCLYFQYNSVLYSYLLHSTIGHKR